MQTKKRNFSTLYSKHCSVAPNAHKCSWKNAASRLKGKSSSSCCLTYPFAQVFPDHLLYLLHAALRGLAVEHLECACVFLWQQIVKGSQVLSHFDKGAPVGTAQVSETFCRTQVHLERERKRQRQTYECSEILMEFFCPHNEPCICPLISICPHISISLLFHHGIVMVLPVCNACVTPAVASISNGATGADVCQTSDIRSRDS